MADPSGIKLAESNPSLLAIREISNDGCDPSIVTANSYSIPTSKEDNHDNNNEEVKNISSAVAMIHTTDRIGKSRDNFDSSSEIFINRKEYHEIYDDNDNDTKPSAKSYTNNDGYQSRNVTSDNDAMNTLEPHNDDEHGQDDIINQNLPDSRSHADGFNPSGMNVNIAAVSQEPVQYSNHEPKDQIFVDSNIVVRSTQPLADDSSLSVTSQGSNETSSEQEQLESSNKKTINTENLLSKNISLSHHQQQKSLSNVSVFRQPSVVSRVVFRSVVSESATKSVQENISVSSYNQKIVNSIENSTSKTTSDHIIVNSTIEASEKDITFVYDTVDGVHELEEGSRLTYAGQDTTLPLAIDNERFFLDNSGSIDSNSGHNKNQCIGYHCMLMNALNKVQSMRQQKQEEAAMTNNNQSKNNQKQRRQQQQQRQQQEQQQFRCPANNEVTTVLGKSWRCLFRNALYYSTDRINSLLISRNAGHSLQEHLPFLTGYESFLLGGVIKEFDLSDITKYYYHQILAFQNRNTSRIITQQVLHFGRWAWFYHLSTGMTYSRSFSFLSQFFNFFAFPITENDSIHKYDPWYRKLLRLYHCILYVIRSTPILRKFLCCNYVEDYYTRDYRDRASINLGAEVHGIESYNLEKYGTYYGRKEITKFRQEHRLNIDESIVRSFMSNPIGTMIHNGIEHCLLCMSKHWKNMLYQNNGNFAHQRLEQLSPFDVLREAIPEVLCTLSGIRGRNQWDMTTLGPFVRKLQSLDPARVKRRKAGQKNKKNDIETGEKKEGSLAGNNKPYEGSHDNNDNEDEDDNEIFNPCNAAKKLITEMKEKIVPKVCGKIPSRMNVFNDWLDTIYESFDEVANEAVEIRNFVRTVDIGINLGCELLRVVNWKVPSDSTMKKSIVNHILDKKDMKMHYKQLNAIHGECDSIISRELVISALSKLASKDERTLRELIHQKLCDSVPAGVLLLNRAKTLLIREIRRKAVDDKIKEISKGDAITDVSELQRNNWYWINHKKDTAGDWLVLVFRGIQHKSDSVIKEEDTFVAGEHVLLKFHDSVTGIDYIFDYNDNPDHHLDANNDPNKLNILKYVPVAEAISRAQKVYMTIELDHGKRFSYHTFMEFGSASNDKSLRNRLCRLATLSQIQSYELDKARLNVLTETKNSVNNPNKKRDFSFGRSRCILEARPQNVIFLGGGPTGLLGAIHCLHNVILTGGEVKVYEARDAFDQEASSFERAQIVRLDARLVAMIRYHLGTGFEDVYIPARGEAHAHLGNSLPSQGFIEVTIKRLESMLLDEVINLRSRGLLHFFSDSAMSCNGDSGTFQKIGQSLKQGDLLYDPDVESGSLKVRDFEYESSLPPQDLVVGQDYDVIHPREKRVRCYRLVRADRDFDWYHLSAYEPGVRDISGGFRQLPPIYAKGSGRTDPIAIILENEDSIAKRWEFDQVKNQNFQLDVSNCHVVLALGKPAESQSHFTATTSEPYAILCIEGLKISKGMHNFGEKRFGETIIDDYRTLETSNTRIVGDFMKSIRIDSIVTTIEKKLQHEALWQYHLDQLAGTCKDKIPAIHAQLLAAARTLTKISFQRRRLQTRFFELGNTYYLGMEIPREYHAWKVATVAKIAPDKCAMTPEPIRLARQAVQKTLSGHIDRLWYDSVLDVLRLADVYEVEGRRKIPTFYTIDSPFEIRLGDIEETDAFRMFRRTYTVHLHEGNGFTKIRPQHEHHEFRIPSKTYVLDLSANCKKFIEELGRDDHFEPIDTFEVLFKAKSFSIVRTSGGYVSKMPHDVRVGRVSDLSRAPDGYSESKVAIATFPVQHNVNHRCLRVNRVRGKRGEDGYITAHVGDAQASPHFMRYSGLTGAGINVMSFNNLVGQAIRGVDFEARIQRYAFETNWSSGEVVHRGTGNNYGQDGFLRPGYTYSMLIDFLFEKMREIFEIGNPQQSLLNRDWKIRIAAAIVPRGLENDTLFYNSLLAQLEAAIHNKMRQESKLVGGGKKLSPDLWDTIEQKKISVCSISKEEALSLASVYNLYVKCHENNCYRTKIETIGSMLKIVLITLKEIIDSAIQLRLHNQRISSELYNQPKPVDSLVESFGMDAQTIANKATRCVVSAVATVGFHKIGDAALTWVSIIFAVFTFFNSYDILFGALRYRKRMITHIKDFATSKYCPILRNLFSLMTKDQRDLHPGQDPFLIMLETSVNKFISLVVYYDSNNDHIQEFQKAYERFRDSDRTETRIIHFIRELVERFIADIFHENSYLQEGLVNVYKDLLEMRSLGRQHASIGMSGVDQLFRKVKLLAPELEHFHAKKHTTKQTTKHSAPKKNNQELSIITVAVRHMFAPLLGHSKIVKHTWAIASDVNDVLHFSGQTSTATRSAKDLSELYHATCEYEFATAVMVCAMGTLLFSLIMMGLRIAELIISPTEHVRLTDKALSWMMIFPLLGASICVAVIIPRFGHLQHLLSDIKRFQSKNNRLEQVCSLIKLRMLIAFIQLLAICTGIFCIIWILIMTIVSNHFPGKVAMYLSLGGVIASFLVAVLSSYAEYVILFSTDPCMAITVCDVFHLIINEIYNSFANSKTGLEIETHQQLEKEALEYTAREFLHDYRFDHVFDANRLGMILQCIQSGNKQQ